jgi:hypothetical protein
VSRSALSSCVRDRVTDGCVRHPAPRGHRLAVAFVFIAAHGRRRETARQRLRLGAPASIHCGPGREHLQLTDLQIDACLKDSRIERHARSLRHFGESHGRPPDAARRGLSVLLRDDARRKALSRQAWSREEPYPLAMVRGDAQLLLDVGHHRVRQARFAEVREVLNNDLLP